jgi:hypothetical protein
VLQKDFARAERNIEESVRIAKNTCGPTCDALSEAYAAMSTLHMEQGHAADASRYADLSLGATPPRARQAEI